MHPVYFCLQVMVKDITKWESRHGRIPDGAFVMMNSGWDRWWKNDDSLGAVGSLNETGMPISGSLKRVVNN